MGCVRGIMLMHELGKIGEKEINKKILSGKNWLWCFWE